MNRWFWALLVAASVAAPSGADDDKEPDQRPRAHFYGFLPPEIYKLDFRIRNLLARDVDSDGKTDLVVVNSQKNRIDVLRQRKEGEPVDADSDSDDVNDIPSDARLVHRKIPVSRGIASLDVKDVDADGHADLVFLGSPPGLYIEYQNEAGSFPRKRSFAISDVQRNPWMLDVGDLNSDGRNEIAFLGRQNLYLTYQNADGRFEEPKRYRHTAEGASLIRILDFNGDGRNDVVYLSQDAKFPVLARFQNHLGRLGPERRFKIDPVRSVSYANVDDKPGLELLTIGAVSERLHVYTVGESKNDDEAPTSQMVIFPFEKSGAGTQTDLVAADFDGDGRTDVITPDPGGARIMLYRQTEEDGLDVGTPFPAMRGTTVLRTLDGAKEGGVELLSLSGAENAIGASRFADGRLTYPQILPTKGDPVVMETLGSGDDLRIVYLASSRDPETRTDKFALRVFDPAREKDEWVWNHGSFGSKQEIELKLDGKPFDLRAVDADGDGRDDLMFFFLFQPPVLLLAQEDGLFKRVDKSSQGTLGTISPAALHRGSLDGKDPALLIAQNNFARNMRFAEGRWKVLDQYNSGSPSARITGIEALDLDGDGELELALYDRASESVLFLKRREGLYRRWRELKVAPFSLLGTRVADFDSDGRPDLLLFDADKMGIAYTGRKDIELVEIAGFETKIRNGKLGDMIAGDVNDDGKLDIVLIEVAKHNLEIIAVEPGPKLEKALHWTVFEEKTFRRGLGGIEPREAVIADVNSDGRNDIALIVHDRVLVYLQDSGVSDQPAVAGDKPSQPDGKQAVERVKSE